MDITDVSKDSKADFKNTKKNARPKVGQQGGTGLGMPIPMTRKRERAGLRRATAYSQKRVFNVYCDTFRKIKTASLILIKDYTEKMSKDCRQKDEKEG